MANIFRLLFWAILLATSVDSAKILVFFCQWVKSHQIVYHSIIRELAARGHEVDFYTHHPIPNPPKTLKQFQFPIENFGEVMNAVTDNFNIAEKPQTLFEVLKGARLMKGAPFVKPCYESDSVKELLASNRTYHAVIGEFSVWQEDFAVFMHKFKALGINVQSFPDYYWLSELSGLPHNPSYMIPPLSDYSDKMSFFERLDNFRVIVSATLLEYYFVLGPYQKLADEKLRYEGWETRPSILELVSDCALFLTSSHHSLGYSYPRAPHVKEVLGTQAEANPKPLPKDLQDFMDSAEHGVVYFSLGTIVSVDALRRSGSFEPVLKIFSTLKQKVVWKWTSWSGDKPPSIPNIHFSAWLPQQSILAHPKVKLFMTHGGFGSLTEAVQHGVPIIGVPVLGDQGKNIKLAANLGLGVELSFNNVTEKSVNWALNELINNPSYKKEASRRSSIFKDRPMKPVDEAVYWIEYVLRHGKVLQPASVHMPFYQIYMLDVIGFIVAGTAVTIFILYHCYRFLFSLMKRLAKSHGRSSSSSARESKKSK